MLSNSRSGTVMGGTAQREAETAIAERYEALLRVSQTLISTRSSEELFRLLARELRAVVNFYVMGVGIYDENAHQVHLTSYGAARKNPMCVIGEAVDGLQAVQQGVDCPYARYERTHAPGRG